MHDATRPLLCKHLRPKDEGAARIGEGVVPGCCLTPSVTAKAVPPPSKREAYMSPPQGGRSAKRWGSACRNGFVSFRMEQPGRKTCRAFSISSVLPGAWSAASYPWRCLRCSRRGLHTQWRRSCRSRPSSRCAGTAPQVRCPRRWRCRSDSCSLW